MPDCYYYCYPSSKFKQAKKHCYCEQRARYPSSCIFYESICHVYPADSTLFGRSNGDECYGQSVCSQLRFPAADLRPAQRPHHNGPCSLVTTPSRNLVHNHREHRRLQNTQILARSDEGFYPPSPRCYPNILQHIHHLRERSLACAQGH